MPFVIVTGRVITDSTGAEQMLPVLLTPAGPLKSLVDYCLSRRRSLSWHEKLLRSVKLFLEYLESNSVDFEQEWRIFRNFSEALRNGTVSASSGGDPSGLYWSRMDDQTANQLVLAISEFFDWLGREDTRSRSRAFNPADAGGVHEQWIDQRAYQFRKSKAFLGHTWLSEPIPKGRLTRGNRPPKVYSSSPPSFPEDRIEELLFKGFKVGGKQDFRGMAITCLLLGGGLRVSEPFHLYALDVQPHWHDPTAAFVAIHHPSLGTAPRNWSGMAEGRRSRADYLRIEYGLTPRNLVRGKLHAGWKNPALDARYFMQVHWFPQEIYGRLFLQLWTRYLERIVSVERNHPFAWINLDREPVGGIYTMGSYLKALHAAVERIGMTFGKSYGTTGHGPRHSYGQRARRGGINPVILQRMMHHCDPESQRVYTQPEMAEVMASIKIASSRLADDANAKIDRFERLIIE